MDVHAQQIETLNRGVVALPQASGEVYVGWRLLATDQEGIAFNVYRTSNGATSKLNELPLTESTNFVDAGADLSSENAYFVRPVLDGEEQEASSSFVLPADASTRSYLTIPLQDDLSASARLVATGDLDGDGAYDFVVKRGNLDIDPSQNTQWTEADTYKLEAYKSDGTFLWRFDMGVNIRPGIWYSPFLVYDLDGDGSAEVAAKIGEVGEDWNGDGTTDYREPSGRILSGPEYLVLLDGETGQIEARADWIERGDIADWGDDYGNRANRNMLAVAYLDGEQPSLIMMRGLYGGQSGFSSKMEAEAWNYRNGELSLQWDWRRSPGGAGFQNYRVGDVDRDGRHEFVHGSVAIDDDGTTMWATGEGHGDRMHMTDISPQREGLEIWYVQEGGYEHPVHLRDAATGDLLWGKTGNWGDVGRGTAADIDPRYEGIEVWASSGNFYSAAGETIGRRPLSVNMAIWWDGDLLRELLDGTEVAKWDWEQFSTDPLLTAQGLVGSRNAPMGYADVFGDWREEVWYVTASGELRIYTTTIPTSHRFATMMHDLDYRTSVAAETNGYMQATQPSFYFGPDMLETSQETTSSPPSGINLQGVFPHPVRHTASAVFEAPMAGRYHVAIYDVLGRVVHERQVHLAAAGRRQLRFDVRDQPGGLYVLTVTSARTGRSATQRFAQIQ